jgi:iron complex outermembrane receptor protein
MKTQSKGPNRALRTVLLAGGGSLILAGQALAQAAAPATSTIEEVIVTAQKRAENVQNVPLSVTPLTAATIERLHVQDTKDLVGTVPNVQVQVNAAVGLAASYVIRGIGIANNPTPYVGTEVGTVIDGVVIATNSMGLTDQFDVERIEVLRGPQGTLFGANTTGGVINIIMRQPTGEFGGYGKVTMGNYHRLDGSAAVNFPIVKDVLAGKIAFSHRGRDGFYRNLNDGERIGGAGNDILRAYLLWTPEENADVTLAYDLQKIRNGQDILHPLAYPGEVFYRPGTPTRDFVIYSDVPDFTNAKIEGATLTANLDSAIGRITSITNYRHYSKRANQDLDGVNAFLYVQAGYEKGWQQSQEIRDVFRPTDDIEVLVGGFAQVWGYKTGSLTLPRFSSPTAVGLGVSRQRSTNLAGFTQVYWDITDRLRMQGGLRVSWEKVRLFRANFSFNQPAGTISTARFGNLVGATLLPINPANAPSEGEHSWTNVGGKLGIDYKLADDVMAYGYYARGFKSGGFNGRVTRSQDIGPFDPEYVDSFEVGLKSDLLDKRLRLNVSAFLNKWKDMQVTQSVYSGTIASSLILNAGKATTKGVEFEGEFVPFDGLRLNATVGYLKARYDEFRSGSGEPCPPLPAPQPVGCSIDYSGRHLMFSPKWNASLTGTYTFALAGGETNATLQYTHNGRRWGNFTYSPSERLAPVDLWNGNLSWRPQGAKWSIAAWGRNIFDKRYLNMAADFPPLFTEGVLGSPRQFGVDFDFEF